MHFARLHALALSYYSLSILYKLSSIALKAYHGVQDIVKKNAVPPEFHCRQVLPTSGSRSVSVWDVDSLESFQHWLDETMEADCESEVFEVQEGFAYGLPTALAAARAAEKVQSTGRSTAKDVSAMATQFDERYHVSESAASLAKAAKETGTAAVKNLHTGTAAVFTSVSSNVNDFAKKTMENENVASTASVFRGFGSKLGASFKSLQDSFVKLDTPAYGMTSPAAGAASTPAPHVSPKATAAAQPAVMQQQPAPPGTLPTPDSAAHVSAAAPARPEEAFSLGD